MTFASLGSSLFVGERLRVARQARGLTIRALADISGLHENSIRLFEKAVNQPKAETLATLAQSLNVLPSYFASTGKTHSSAPVFYRSLAATTATARTRAQARLNWTEEIAEWLQQFVDFPGVGVPDFGDAGDVLSLSDQQIDGIAAQVRAHWGLGTGVIENVVWLLESRGVIVTRGEGGSSAIDAFSRWDAYAKHPHIFLCDEKGSAYRSRLDAAHELGHLVMHRRITESVQRNPMAFKQIERQAFRFAASFLLPATMFTEYVPSLSLDTLLMLKSTLKASVKMMLKRGLDLGYHGAMDASHVWRAYSRRGWQSGEPGDDTEPLEQPELLRSAVEYVVENGVRSRAEVIASLGLPAQDIEEISGVEPGYLTPVKPMIRPAAVLHPPASVDTGETRVLQFPRSS